MNVNTQKFQSLYALVGNRWHGGTIGRHSLSQPLRAASSLREGAGKRPPQCQSPARWMFFQRAGDFCVGGYLPFNRVLAKPWGCGRFSSPLRNSENLTLYHSTDDTPSVSFADSSLREGAGVGLYHSIGYSLKSGGTGDFRRPYERVWKVSLLPFNSLLALG